MRLWQARAIFVFFFFREFVAIFVLMFMSLSIDWSNHIWKSTCQSNDLYLWAHTILDCLHSSSWAWTCHFWWMWKAMTLYSASVLDLATTFCFLLFQDTRFPPTSTQYLEVNHLSIGELCPISIWVANYPSMSFIFINETFSWSTFDVF